MDVGWNYEIKDDQRTNPVVFAQQVNLPDDIIFPTEDMLKKVFKTEKFKERAGRLKTWGRLKGSDGKIAYKDSPHWIAVRNGTPLHLDPPYPRYSHHLKIRVDDGMFVRGLDKIEMQLHTGTFYILDTHSPHQVFSKNQFDSWNVAISIDSDNEWAPDKAIQACLNYAANNDFVRA